ncbi:related to 3-oxoacyl-(acyl carrier protein) reductase [Fusarium fujikuroi IMI 58289]|uniref:Related to 3-oxoacyl-(Acyl carrier protein) reductase n=1 Tax=Gibberella fujikuroi (strain CBS 195.34 / IMI 58289 / NRRL A-6831) TaxID=1279085 RepID=S0DS12_GIBF5|nr:related to 3-oxoacyl-(acyl carrier protein) reductase [Fusarium fujikuroi IMI 58289]CCT65236.1 related to 3-oxoacyl-(acyl carrier protein) reductase [Fusarium fujikuroi IMI 58289]SCO23819.1 related to 3-oxoacyl-(acyl carrier protein) reductase [Fusarium fujikuroi]
MSSRIQNITNHLAPDGDQTTRLMKGDPSRIDGQVVLITGGAQGIGKAAANLLASKGGRIIIADVDKSKASATVQELQSGGYEAAYIIGDALEDGFAEKTVAFALETFGKVHCLINGAGFCYDAAIHKMDDDKFDVIMKIHNYVPFRMVRALSSHWMARENREMPKTIINISSTSGLHGQMGQINYSTAKMGIVGQTKTIASEWARYGVRCNAVAYGWIDTRITRPPTSDETVVVGGKTIQTGIPIAAKKFRDVSEIPLSRPGTVEDAAGVILFLASPLSAYVTGSCIECAGGRYL